jgi:hypothetical protein
MMSSEMPAAGSETAPAQKSRMARWAGIITAICGILILAIQLLNWFVLPGCDASKIQDTVRSIFKDNGTPLDRLSDIKPLPDQNGRKTCAARVGTPTQTADITYSVFWEGWTTRVQIGQVNVVPSAGGTAR